MHGSTIGRSPIDSISLEHSNTGNQVEDKIEGPENVRGGGVAGGVGGCFWQALAGRRSGQVTK